MNIIIEGPDNSGKSTLAKAISKATGKIIVPSQGPPRYKGEINNRINGYMAFQDVIFDRHPAISNPIYESFREDKEPTADHLIKSIYNTKPLIIYCRGNKTLAGHQIKEHDSERHLAMLELHHKQLCRLYDSWALEHAHIVYRIGDPIPITEISFDPVEDISQFHGKFDLIYHGKPRMLPIEMHLFRFGFMQEELDEYKYWCTRRSEHEAVPLEGALDSLIDLVYVALGTSYLHGFNFREGWRRVHRANMKKVRAENAKASKRNSTLDVVKPPDWQAPSLRDLVES